MCIVTLATQIGPRFCWRLKRFAVGGKVQNKGTFILLSLEEEVYVLGKVSEINYISSPISYLYIIETFT